MLFLVFQSDGKKYALPCSYVERILPYLEPNGGAIIYAGRSLPVVDWNLWMTGVKSHKYLNTRILVISGLGVEFGLQAEGVTSTIELPEETERIYAASTIKKPFVKELIRMGDAYIQMIDGEGLIREVEKCIKDSRQTTS